MIPDGYEIDAERGIIYGKKGRPIVNKDVKGYIRVRSCKNRIGFAHRLIWESVHGQIPLGLAINHINGIKTDNRIKNLELATLSENSKHAHRTGLLNNRGSSNGMAKLTEQDVNRIRKMIASGEPLASIAKSFGVSSQAISAIKSGHAWRTIHDHA